MIVKQFRQQYVDFHRLLKFETSLLRIVYIIYYENSCNTKEHIFENSKLT